MNRYSFAVAITGTRKVGKDTLYQLVRQINPQFKRYAFADAVRSDLEDFLKKHYGIDVWNCTEEGKEVIRPFLITHGMAKRRQDPLHWVKKTIASITASSPTETHPFITDCRFANEAMVLKDAFPNFRLINLARIGAPDPTDEEKKHFQTVSAMADYHILWGDDTEAQRAEIAAKLVQWLENSVETSRKPQI